MECTLHNLYLKAGNPAEFAYLPDWFGQRVEIDIENFGIPQGVWLQVDDLQVSRLTKSAYHLGQIQRPTDEQRAKRNRIEAILARIDKLPRTRLDDAA